MKRRFCWIFYYYYYYFNFNEFLYLFKNKNKKIVNRLFKRQSQNRLFKRRSQLFSELPVFNFFWIYARQRCGGGARLGLSTSGGARMRLSVSGGVRWGCWRAVMRDGVVGERWWRKAGVVQWVFLGCPGVGKGTYANRLCNLLGIPHIATGDLVHEELASSGPLSQQVSISRIHIWSLIFRTKVLWENFQDPNSIATGKFFCSVSTANWLGGQFEALGRCIALAWEIVSPRDDFTIFFLTDIKNALKLKNNNKKNSTEYNKKTLLQHVKNVVKMILQHFSVCCRMRCCRKCQTFNNFQFMLSSMLLNI